MPAAEPGIGAGGVIGFAHRGARAECRDNTLPSFARALELGAEGLESDVWASADGVAVLDHDGVVRRGLRRVPVATLARDDLPAHIPTLDGLYALAGASVELSLDVKDETAAILAVRAAEAAGAAGHLWLCGPWPEVARWRSFSPALHLVNSTRRRRVADLAAHAAALASGGVAALNLPHQEWDADAVALLHRHGVRAFAWDLQSRSDLDAALAIGVDAVYSDHVGRMVEAVDASPRGGLRTSGRG